ncbi:hypothetical protein FACS18948_2980 [Clostridia bacterium]|nr:hypothetical protein FACS18948_2980 [Clostridia bacterium]
MAKKKPVILGTNISINKALGITNAKRKIARATGIPTTKQGRQRKLEREVVKAVHGKGCLVTCLLFCSAVVTMVVVISHVV